MVGRPKRRDHKLIEESHILKAFIYLFIHLFIHLSIVIFIFFFGGVGVGVVVLNKVY